MSERGTQAPQVRFRETDEGIAKLDEALKVMGFRTRSEWYGQCLRQLFKEAKEAKKGER